ncbi:MAG: hypothetical protein ABW168_00290 [Sedimenticola sp.]
MIIATVGNNDYLMDTLDDAEALLRILSRAICIDENYELPHGTQRYHKLSSGSRIKIEIVEGELLEYEEALALVEKEKEKRELRSA